MLSNRAGLSVDEDYDETKELKEFYVCNLPHLFTCSVNLIDPRLIRKMAVRLYDTETFTEDWRLFATEMGIDHDKIAEIKAAAFCRQDLPVFIAMDKEIRKHGSFGNIIQALLNTNRLDILKMIEADVRSLLLKLSHKQTSNSSSLSCKNENCANEKIAQFPNEPKYEHNSIQQHAIDSLFKNGLRICESSKLPEQNLQEMKIPSAPEEDKLTVLIQHAESDSGIAEKLAEEFSKEGLIATTLTQVNNYTLYEPESVLNTIFKEVDFIVPIVSSTFLEEIHRRNHDHYLDSAHVQNNSKLQSLVMSEYRKNRRVNFRVRPTIVPEMSRKSIESSDEIFSFTFRLWKEVPKLISVLKETKDLNAYQFIR